MIILLISALLGVALLALEIFKLRSWMMPLMLLSFLAILAGTAAQWGMSENIMNQNMMMMDAFALKGIAIITILAAFWLLLQHKHIMATGNGSDLYALIAFSFCGAILMTNFTNMVMLFLAIEILSIPLYVLAASKRGNRASNEAGFKYFLLGSVASSILLFGIAMIYGATASFDLYVIHDFISTQPTNYLVMVGIGMILVGFAFKISAAPFHFWAPDVYQGAPTPITGWMATVVKGAAIIGMYRLFAGAFEGSLHSFNGAIAIMVTLTLIIANGMATLQMNVKRMLAFSGVSHAGFLLSSLLIPGFNSETLMFYILSYGIASLISFYVMQLVGNQIGEDLHSFDGLAKKSPFTAAIMSIALLSMAGIPPLAGFFGKYYIISGLMGHYTWLTIIMILTSVIGMYYYLKVIFAMYGKNENAKEFNEGNRLLVTIGGIALMLLFALSSFI
jgi:NADH-quinone oxidoreductase subunit N